MIIMVWEMVAPLRVQSEKFRIRWSNNIALGILNNVILSYLSPLAAVVFAFKAQEMGWGLLNILNTPGWLSLIVTFVFLDAMIYLRHLAQHKIPFLWRTHRLHHDDQDFDVTTSVRFHPLEVIYQLGCQVFAVAAIGAPPLAVACFSTFFVFYARFQHGNIRVPASLERQLRKLLMTADLHRIHHSARMCETDSNYGGIFPWFDQLFGTYVCEAQDGQIGMKMGLDEFRDRKHMTLGWMLLSPLLNPPCHDDNKNPSQRSRTISRFKR